MPDKQENADLNDLVRIINNPQHEMDLELPGRDPEASDSAKREDPDASFTLYDLELPIPPT